MPYSPVAVANTLLQRSFGDGIPISAQRLHALCYIAATRYPIHTAAPLFGDHFTAYDAGPVQYSTYDKFRVLGDEPIVKYAPLAGEKLVLNEHEDPALARVLHSVWIATRGVDTAVLTVAITQPGSAWAAARERGQHYLDNDEVARDRSYQHVVGVA